ncbi:MAG: helicase HerA-like domain-containing protein [Hungatella sp.]
MFYEGKVWIAKSGDHQVSILPKMANRHGLIAGATGTGKTITLKVLAESFSDAGVPVFLADVKGDLAGMCQPGVDSADMQKRIAAFGLAEAGFQYHAYPTCFWDIFEKEGLPLRTTISEMGATLLARLLDLNATQTDILTIVFRIADEQGILLLDTKDLRAMLSYVGEHHTEYTTEYGNITKQSIGAIMRSVVAMEEEGGDQFFGEPALDIHDWFRTDFSGKGMINILHCASLINNPKIYSTFMLWMLSELFEVMPEAGDCEKPRMVFFFDEAHLLFQDAPKVLLQKIEQVVKLIRSKGVGIYFITQSPSDIPDGVLAQLGNKIQHALHAYTPSDQKAVRAAAQSFRVNPKLDTEQVLTELGIGEALVSFLQEDGSPSVVERCFILPPQSRMGTITEDQRQANINDNPLFARYGVAVERDSAYEFFQRKTQQEATEDAAELNQKAQEQMDRQALKDSEREAKEAAKEEAKEAKEAAKEEAEAKRAKKRAMAPISGVAKSAAGTIGRELGNEFGKKIGGTFGKRLGGNIGATLGRGILDTLFGR